MTKTERKYSVTEKELLAVVWATKHFHFYVFDRNIKIFTDHKPLSTMVRPSEATGRIANLLFKLPTNYEILYLSGKDNFFADMLSRLPKANTADFNNLSVNETVDWKKEQMLDDDIRNLVKGSKNEFKNFNWYDLKYHHVWNRVRGQLEVLDDVLVLKDHNRRLVVVPNHMQSKVCQWYHDDPGKGHLGLEKTYYDIRQKFFWPNMLSVVCEYCKTCEICQKCKASNSKIVA
jgi:hypothetical protein